MAFSIDTERLSLRLRTKDDAECNLKLLQEHEGGTTLTLDDVAKRMVERSIEAHKVGFGVLSIRRLKDSDPIGYCGLIVGRGSIDEPEIAYEILPEFQGHGYATEAAAAVVEAAFATGRKRIWATVGSWNVPSFRVLEKNGFSPDHTDTGENGEFVWMVRNAPA
jgi:RimJ/RimL family protein N-acetyltransferase